MINIDWFSFGLGALVTLIVLVIVMVFACAWVAEKSYKMGWKDCKKGKWIGDKCEE